MLSIIGLYIESTRVSLKLAGGRPDNFVLTYGFCVFSESELLPFYPYNQWKLEQLLGGNYEIKDSLVIILLEGSYNDTMSTKNISPDILVCKLSFLRRIS